MIKPVVPLYAKLDVFIPMFIPVYSYAYYFI